jgi:DNA-binding transcriptional MerR regulator
MKTAEDVRDSLADVPQMKTIKELCDQVGITARAARFYETIGLVAPMRNEKRRFYSSADVEKVEMIVALKRFRFTLAEIRELLTETQREWDRYPLTPQRCQQQIAFLQVERQEIERAIVDLMAVQAALTTD